MVGSTSLVSLAHSFTCRPLTLALARALPPRASAGQEAGAVSELESRYKMPQDLKIAFVAQPEYSAPLYETDLDDLYEIRRFPIVFDPPQGDWATVTGIAEVIDFAPDIAVFFR